MNTLPWMELTFCERLTAALLHFLWQGSAIAILAAVASRWLGRAPSQTRYAIHVGALIMMFACLPVTYAVMAAGASQSPAMARGASGPGMRPLTAADHALLPSPKVTDSAEEDARTAGLPPGASDPLAPEPNLFSSSSATAESPSAFGSGRDLVDSLQRLLPRWLQWSAPYVTAAYFAGVATLLMRLMWGSWTSRRLGRSAPAVTDSELLDRVRMQAERLGLRILPALKWCADLSVPVVIGVTRPVILLPTSAATGLTMDQIQAVIAHELAHVRRYDLVVNVLQRVIESLLFYHPGVWWVSRQITLEREQACDELVLSAGLGRAQYADALVTMAELSSSRQAPPLATALAADGASPTEFKRRVLKVLECETTPPLRLNRLAAVGVVAAALLVLATPLIWNPSLAETGNEGGQTTSTTDSPAAPPSPAAPAEGTAGAQDLTDATLPGNGIQLAMSPDGKWLAAMNGNPTRTMFRDGRGVARNWQPVVLLIDTATEKVVRSLDLSDLTQDPNRPPEDGPTFIEATAIAFSSDSSTLAVGTSLGQLKLFNTASGAYARSLDDEPGRLADEKTPKQWRELPRVMGRINSLAFSPDGKRLAVCGESFADWSKKLDRVERGGISQTAAGRLKVFDLESGALAFNPPAHSDLVADVAYSPDGRFLASAGRWFDSIENHQFGDGVTLWNAKTGERIARLDLELRGWMYDIEFSADSKHLLIGAQDFDAGGGNGQGVIAMLSAETLAIRWKRSVTRSAMAVAFHPRQPVVVALQNRQELLYLDADTGQTRQELKVTDPALEKQRCEDFAISPRGPRLTVGVVNRGEAQIRFVRFGNQDPTADTGAGTHAELLRMLVRGGKLETKTVNAAITLVAAHAARNPDFAKRVLDEFDRSCRNGSQAKRSLLAVVGEMFDAWSVGRWRAQLAPLNPNDLPQVEPANPGGAVESDALQLVQQHARDAGRADIADFTLAVRALHHPQTVPLLRDVLRNPEGPSSPFVQPGTTTSPNTPTAPSPDRRAAASSSRAGNWKDNLGGTWTDAKFTAAVGLAELGDVEAVEWLLARARPNEFGLDDSLFKTPHLRDPRGSLRESSRLALCDLLGGKPDATATQLADSWKTSQSRFIPRPVTLRPRIAVTASPGASARQQDR